MADETLAGVLDVMLAFALTLERFELIERPELIKTLQCVKNDAERQAGGPCKRSLVVALMLAEFAAPPLSAKERKQFRLIAGGALDRRYHPTDNDEPPAAA
jgi:hypothetical protein